MFPPTPDTTPDPTPTKGPKRNHDDSLSSTQEPGSKQMLFTKTAEASTPATSPAAHDIPHSSPTPTPPPPQRPSPFHRAPAWSIVHPSNHRSHSHTQSTSKPTPTPHISPHELKRASESILHQVDWEELAIYVASNRSGKVYERITKAVLQGKIDELVEERGGEGRGGEGRNGLYEIGVEEGDYCRE